MQNYGESLIFALIFNFRRLKLQRFFKRETMKCVKVKKYVHTRNPIWFFVILFQFLFISFYLSRKIFTYCVKVKAQNTFLHISFADWTLLWTTFRYWNFLLFPQNDSQFEKWSACCIVFTTKTFHIVTQRPSFEEMKPFSLKFLNEWLFKKHYFQKV